jgi:hypothetical protein
MDDSEFEFEFELEFRFQRDELNRRQQPKDATDRGLIEPAVP